MCPTQPCYICPPCSLGCFWPCRVDPGRQCPAPSLRLSSGAGLQTPPRLPQLHGTRRLRRLSLGSRPGVRFRQSFLSEGDRGASLRGPNRHPRHLGYVWCVFSEQCVRRSAASPGRAAGIQPAATLLLPQHLRGPCPGNMEASRAGSLCGRVLPSRPPPAPFQTEQATLATPAPTGPERGPGHLSTCALGGSVWRWPWLGLGRQT